MITSLVSSQWVNSGTADIAFTATGGKVGIGVVPSAASEKFEVTGNIALSGSLKLASSQEVLFADNGQIKSYDNMHRILFRRSENKMEFREYGDIVFSPGASSGVETAKMTLRADGVLKITNRIDAAEFRSCVSAATGDCPPDYVFEKDYKLMDLSSLKKYLDHNKHLPEVPSAKEMFKNGLNMKEMDMVLLKKVEELTLYILELENRISNMEKR